MNRLSAILSSGLLCLSYFYTLNAQSQKDSLTAHTIILRADSLFKANRFKDCIPIYEDALLEYKKNGLWERAAHCYHKMTASLFKNQKPDDAKNQIEKGIALVERYNLQMTKTNARLLGDYGYYFLIRRKNKDAILYYNNALRIQTHMLHKYSSEIARNQTFIASAYLHLFDFESAKKHLGNAKVICDKNSDENLTNLGVYYHVLGKINRQSVNYEAAIKSMEMAIQIFYSQKNKDMPRIATAEFELGQIYFNTGSYDKSLHHFLNVVPVFVQLRGEQSAILAVIYDIMAKAFCKVGLVYSALQYNEKAIEINHNLFEKDHINFAYSFASKANTLYEMNKREEALNYFLKAAKIFEKNKGAYRNLVDIYSDIGNLFSNELNDIDTALEYYEKSIVLGKKILGQNLSGHAATYHLMALSQLKHGRTSDAFTNLTKAMEIAKMGVGGKKTEIALIHNSFAEYYKHIGVYPKAIFEYEKALQIYNGELSDILNSKISDLSFDALKVICQSLNGIAVNNRIIFIEKGDENYLIESYQIYEKVEQVAKRIRETLTTYEDKLIFSKIYKEYVSGAITTTYLLSQNSKESTRDNLLFGFFEKSKANILSEKLTNTAPKPGHLQKLIAHNNSLQRQKSKLMALIKKEEDKGDSVSMDSLQLLKDEYFKKIATKDSLEQQIKKKHPAYFVNNHSDQNISLTELQDKLDVNTGLLEYFVADSTVYTFFITKKEHWVKKIHTPDLEDAINAFRKAIVEKDIISFKSLGNKIYQVLLEPIEKLMNGEELIIVPHGYLWGLDFDLLQTEEVVSKNPKELPYLMRNFAVSYANSASLLYQYTDSKERSGKAPECLAFSFTGNSDKIQGNSISLSRFGNVKGDLPGTREEIREIAKIVDGKYYYGSQAVESKFKSEAGSYAILHLALHGEVDQETPQNSRLYFNQIKDSIEDNYLYMHELMNEEIGAELAVLSACDTGAGKIVNGEGVMSLGSAFQYAGTHSLLLSKWEVSDATSPKLMKHFYQNLKDGMSKSKALQKAKLSYLATADVVHCHPYYWSSYYVLGDNSSITFGTNMHWVYISVIFGILLLTWILVKKRKVKLV